MKKTIQNEYFKIIMGLILLLVVNAIGIMQGHISTYTDKKYLMFFFVGLYFMVGILLCVAKKLNKFPYAIVAFVILIAIHFNVMFQWISNGGKSYFYFQMENILDMIIYIFVIAVLCLIFKKLKTSLLVNAAFIYIFGFFNYNLYNMRGKPACIGDLLSVKTALSVSSEYKIIFDKNVIDFTVVLCISVILVCKIISIYKDEEEYSRYYPVKVGTTVVLFSVVVYSIATGMIQHMQFMRYDGYFAKSIAQLQQILTIKPDDYDKNVIEKVAEKYTQSEGKSEVDNIIIIANETYSEVQEVYSLALNKKITEINSAEGYLSKFKSYSSVYGGNTPNTEFEVLTGGSLIAFPVDTIPFSSHINNENITSIAEQLNKLKFNNYAMHPCKKSNWNRTTVYDIFGFEKMEFIEDFDETKVGKVRANASDEWVYEQLYSKIIENDNKQFLYTITMQNHGGYTWGYDDNGIEIQNEDYPLAEEYLNLIDESNKAINKLFEKLSSVNEKTVVVIFGDHQPAVETEIIESIQEKMEGSTEEKNMIKYEVPVYVWSNYDIGKIENRETSMNYIAPIVFEHIGIPLTGFQQYLLELYEEFPVITANGGYDSNGKFYKREELLQNKKIKEYVDINYNMIIDKDKLTDFYQLK